MRPLPHLTAILLAASAFCATDSARAQLAPPAAGFATETLVHPLSLNPYGSLTLELPDGDLLTFDGRLVERRDALGNPLATLLDLGMDTFGSFLLLSPDGTYAVLAESSVGNVYRIDLAAGTGVLLEFVPLAFSAAFEPAGTLVISAATTSFSSTDIVRIDPLSPGSGYQTLASLPGSSGPIEVLPSGDLIYAVPPPFGSMMPGTVNLLRFPVELLGVSLLTLNDAVFYSVGFDGAGDLYFDPVGERLYLAENNFGLGVSRLRQVVVPEAAFSPVLYEAPSGQTVGIESGRGPSNGGSFAPYQPAEFGGALTLTQTDFFASDVRFELQTARPTAALIEPGAGGPGTVDFSVIGGPANGLLALGFAPTTALVPEVPLLFLEPALFTGLDLGQLQILPTAFALDAAGEFSATLPNTALPPGVSFQGLVIDPLAGGVPVGTTTIVSS